MPRAMNLTLMRPKFRRHCVPVGCNTKFQRHFWSKAKFSLPHGFFVWPFSTLRQCNGNRSHEESRYFLDQQKWFPPINCSRWHVHCLLITVINYVLRDNVWLHYDIQLFSGSRRLCLTFVTFCRYSCNLRQDNAFTGRKKLAKGDRPSVSQS